MILTSYLYVGVQLAPVSIVTLWIQVVMDNCCKQFAITTCIHSVTILTGANLLETPLFFL
jgi:hypothetical protein